MELVDANIILRYLVRDIEEQTLKAKEILENRYIEIPFEVIAEVVYVLEDLYKVSRLKIKTGIIGLFKYRNIETADLEVLLEALNIFVEKKLDFVDSLLLGYKRIRSIEVHTFDKKLKKLLEAV